MLPTKMRLLVAAAGAIAAGCSSTSERAGEDSTAGALENEERPNSVCFPGDPATCVKVPKMADLATEFIDDKCFYWNRKSTDRASKIYKILKHSRSQEQDEMTLNQLRAALRYFGDYAAGALIGNPPKRMEDLTIDELFGMAEAPVFYTIEDRQTHEKYRRVNFAAGDNPMDVIYKDGTLEPVAMASDDSLFFCARSFQGK
jgi:hypothetical protein